MVPQYKKTQHNHLAFLLPLLKFFQHNEGEKREECGAANEFRLASSFPPILLNPVSLNILFSLLCAVREPKSTP